MVFVRDGAAYTGRPADVWDGPAHLKMASHRIAHRAGRTHYLLKMPIQDGQPWGSPPCDTNTLFTHGVCAGRAGLYRSASRCVGRAGPP